MGPNISGLTRPSKTHGTRPTHASTAPARSMTSALPCIQRDMTRKSRAELDAAAFGRPEGYGWHRAFSLNILRRPCPDRLSDKRQPGTSIVYSHLAQTITNGTLKRHRYSIILSVPATRRNRRRTAHIRAMTQYIYE